MILRLLLFLILCPSSSVNMQSGFIFANVSRAHSSAADSLRVIGSEQQQLAQVQPWPRGFNKYDLSCCNISFLLSRMPSHVCVPTFSRRITEGALLKGQQKQVNTHKLPAESRPFLFVLVVGVCFFRHKEDVSMNVTRETWLAY